MITFVGPRLRFRHRLDHLAVAIKNLIHSTRAWISARFESAQHDERGLTTAEYVALGAVVVVAAGVVVDTHVIRISNRLDLTHHSDPKHIEQDLMAILPQNKWIIFSHQLIWHGRRVCVARKPRCIECNLEKLCYSKDKTYPTHS